MIMEQTTTTLDSLPFRITREITPDSVTVDVEPTVPKIAGDMYAIIKALRTRPDLAEAIAQQLTASQPEIMNSRRGNNGRLIAAEFLHDQGTLVTHLDCEDASDLAWVMDDLAESMVYMCAHGDCEKNATEYSEFCEQHYDLHN